MLVVQNKLERLSQEILSGWFNITKWGKDITPQSKSEELIKKYRRIWLDRNFYSSNFIFSKFVEFWVH